MKRRFGAVFRRLGFDKPASRPRYKLGLALFLAGNIALVLLAYVPALSRVELTPRVRLFSYLGCDVLIVVSVFVLGPRFWDNLRRLFTWEPLRVELWTEELGRGPATSS